MFVAQCIHDITMAYGLALSLFLAGLVGGVTHCAGMCSPFVLAQVSAQDNMGGAVRLERIKGALLLPYHLGRMTTYVGLAVLVNSVVNLAFLFSDLKILMAVPMLVLAGVLFLLSVFPRLSILFPWGERIQVSAPYRFISRLSSGFIDEPTLLKRYILGVLLGFMPCGLVVSAVLASATAPDIFRAGFSMAAFTVGTMPALILVAFGGQALRSRYPRFARRLSQGALIFSALWLFLLAVFMVL